MQIPILATINKGDVVIVNNGKRTIIRKPSLELYFPEKELKKNVVAEKIDDRYYFIGLNKWDHERNNQTNDYADTVKWSLNYDDWQAGPAKYMPFSFTDYMLVTKKETFKKYAHTKDIRIMCYDIEVCSDGSGIFPKPTKNPIAMIGYKFIDYNPETAEYKNVTDITIIESFKIDDLGKEDNQILIDFMDVIKKYDPDIMCGYNIWGFDTPYIIKRMEMLGIPPHAYTRIEQAEIDKDKMVASLYRHSTDSNPKNVMKKEIMGYRINYDVFHVDVLRDTTLTGLKDKKMKTLAAHLTKDPEEKKNIIVLEEGIEDIYSMMKSESEKERLRQYLYSDIVQTEKICKFYFGNNVDLALQLEVPLNVILGRRNGTIPTMYLFTELLANKMMPFRTNAETYSYLIDRSTNEFKETKFFQGAYVDVKKTGKMPHPLYKYDFKSLYPNNIRTFNISYETVKTSIELIDGEIDPVDSKHVFKRIGDKLYISYNDRVLHARLTVEIDMSKRGLVPKIMDKILTERFQIREDMKKVPKESLEYLKMNTKQQFLKIVANSSYGILAQKTGIGYLPMGTTITACGRWCTMQVCQELDRIMNSRS